MSGEPINPAIDAVLMIEPLFCLSITGSTCFRPKNTPTTLTSSTFRNVASEYFVIGAMSPSMPALL
jgi:hypothetical protein